MKSGPAVNDIAIPSRFLLGTRAYIDIQDYSICKKGNAISPDTSGRILLTTNWEALTRPTRMPPAVRKKRAAVTALDSDNKGTTLPRFTQSYPWSQVPLCVCVWMCV